MEDKFLVIFSGLHIEMAGFRTQGTWLEGSGWVEAIVQANNASSGTAESFIKVSYV